MMRETFSWVQTTDAFSLQMLHHLREINQAFQRHKIQSPEASLQQRNQHKFPHFVVLHDFDHFYISDLPNICQKV